MSLCYDFGKCTIVSMVLLAISLTIGLLFINFGFDSDVKPKWDKMVLDRCVNVNVTYHYMRLSNATECDCIVKWHDTHNWKLVTETNGEIVLTFDNNMTAKQKVFEEGKKENK